MYIYIGEDEFRLELSTVVGLSLGVIAVVVGMMLKGASLASLINPAAIMIIFVGTAGAVLNALPMAQAKKFPLLLKKLLNKLL